MSRRIAAAVGLMFVLAGCESVLGVDFTSYQKNVCSPLVSTSCTSPQACLFDLTKQEFACATPKGTLVENQRCKDESECEPGLACVKFATNNDSHCTRYCAGPGDCATGHECYEFTTPRKLATGTVGGCGALSTACDPLAANTACDGRCVLVDTDYTICVAQEDTRAVGATCDAISQCVPGTTCFGSESAGYKCTQLCLKGGTCATGTCTSFIPAIKLGDTEYGFCK